LLKRATEGSPLDRFLKQRPIETKEYYDRKDFVYIKSFERAMSMGSESMSPGSSGRVLPNDGYHFITQGVKTKGK